MHQVQVNSPKGKGEDVAKVALESGAKLASVQTAYVHGPNKDQDIITVQTDTPTAKKFVDALMEKKFFNPKDYTILSQNMPSIIESQDPRKLTQPFLMPVTDVYEDLWARNHFNPTYFARAIVASLLLAYAMIQNDLITMIAALLFTPFLGQVLAGGFGIATRQWRLAAQGGLVLLASTMITIISGFIVATLMGGPMQYDSFSSKLVNFLISLIVGIVAGIATGDQTGRRELIAMAAAAQFAVYPAWFGIMLVLGLPDSATVAQRWLTFFVNIVTILVVSTAVYTLMQYKGEVIDRFSKSEPVKSKAK